VHHGLVERCEEWIGLSSFRAVCDGKENLEVPHFDEVAWREAGARAEEIADFTEVVTIPLSKPLKWERLSPSELEAARRAHEESVRDRERDKQVERASGSRRALPKPASYAKVDPYSRPAGPVERRPRPWAHGSKEAVEAYRESYSDTLASYRVASAEFRETGELGVFPTGTFAPWAWGMRTVR
jgi:hypothetical protein